MGRDNLLITVVTVCYNADESIEETIKSVISQDYGRLEYIIIDGLSQDKTIDIIERYSGKDIKNEFGHNISKWISEPDSGIYDAMNKGLQLANGDYLIFMGADDVFTNNHVISDVVKWLDEWNGDVIYGAVQMKTSGLIDNKPFDSIKFAIGNICHQCIFYPKKIYTEYQYNTKYRIYADYVYNLTIRKNFRFRHIPLVVSIFNDKGVSGRFIDKEFNTDRRKLLISSIGWKSYIIGNLYRMIMHTKSRILTRKRKLT